MDVRGSCICLSLPVFSSALQRLRLLFALVSSIIAIFKLLSDSHPYNPPLSVGYNYLSSSSGSTVAFDYVYDVVLKNKRFSPLLSLQPPHSHHNDTNASDFVLFCALPSFPYSTSPRRHCALAVGTGQFVLPPSPTRRVLVLC